jgi:hypothetical protein
VKNCHNSEDFSGVCKPAEVDPMAAQRCFSVLVAVAAAFLGWPLSANAVRYEIVSPQSSYVYLVPPEGPGVPGCQPDSFHCAFGISGAFDFNVDLSAGVGEFVNPEIGLSGNEGTTYGPLTAAAAVEALLPAQLSPLPLESNAGGSLLFRQPIPVPPAIRWNSIEVLISGNQLSLTGAYDNTGADGNGHRFEVHAVAVPEPASLLLYAVAVTAPISVRRRGRKQRNRSACVML